MGIEFFIVKPSDSFGVFKRLTCFECIHQSGILDVCKFFINDRFRMLSSVVFIHISARRCRCIDFFCNRFADSRFLLKNRFLCGVIINIILIIVLRLGCSKQHQACQN